MSVGDTAGVGGWSFVCPGCSAPLRLPESGRASCNNCQHPIARTDGVHSLISAAALSKYETFLDTYTQVRMAEGRGEMGKDILRRLPHCPHTHPLAWQWRIRATSFHRLRRILREHLESGDRILDLGAGNGWMSHRLRADGYRPCAVEINVDSRDGLGAAQAFEADWPRIRAGFERLPLADSSADCAIFNASFHYTADPAATLAEAARVVAAGGLIVIVDTPFYQRYDSGRQMMQESQQYFEGLIGQRSDSMDSIGFLTWDRLEKLGRELGLDWHIVRPWYGLGWFLRPLRAKLRRQREPAAFAIACAYNPSSAATD